jgi:fimbrial chaperone protein
VRVALRREVDPARELAYRVYFEEVPSSTSGTFNGLRVALRIGVPVFVAPPGKAAAALAWQAHLTPSGELVIEASNHGTAHEQVKDFEIRSGSQQPVRVAGARYVLPDSTVSWKIARPKDLDPTVPLHVHGLSDQGEISADIARVGP